METLTLQNNDDEITDFGVLSNLSDEKTILEIQIRKNGGPASARVYLDSILYTGPMIRLVRLLLIGSKSDRL